MYVCYVAVASLVESRHRPSNLKVVHRDAAPIDRRRMRRCRNSIRVRLTGRKQTSRMKIRLVCRALGPRRHFFWLLLLLLLLLQRWLFGGHAEQTLYIAFVMTTTSGGDVGDRSADDTLGRRYMTLACLIGL